MKIAIFTGLSASGKSTISKVVSDRLGLPRIDIHSIISEEAHRGGYSRARDWILKTGVKESLDRSREILLDQIKHNRNRSGIVIDEVLDPTTLHKIKERFPGDQIEIVYIKTNRHDRKKFMSKRLGTQNESEAQKERRFIDMMKHAVGIKEIVSQATIRAENYVGIDSAVNTIIQKLEIEAPFKDKEGNHPSLRER